MVTLNELGQGFTGLTLARPTSVTPGHPYLHSAVLSGLGALAGRYAAPTLAGWLNPDADPDRIKLIGTLLGGAGGFLASAPNLFTDPRGLSTWARSGINAETIRRGKDTMYAKGASTKAAYTVDRIPGWNAPFISTPAFNLSVEEALRRGDITPTEAVIAKATANGADSQGRFSPAQAQRSFTGLLFDAGVGAAHGYVLGRVAGAVAGSFGLLSSTQSSKIVPYAAATAGALTTLVRSGLTQ